MAEVDQALKRVRAAAARLAAAETETAAARTHLYEQLRGARDARATWDEMMTAGGISRVTLTKALKR